MKVAIDIEVESPLGPRALYHLYKLLGHLAPVVEGPYDATLLLNGQEGVEVPSVDNQEQATLRDPADVLGKTSSKILKKWVRDGGELDTLEHIGSGSEVSGFAREGVERWVDGRDWTKAEFFRRVDAELLERGLRPQNPAQMYKYLTGSEMPPQEIVEAMASVMALNSWEELIERPRPKAVDSEAA